MFIFHWRKKASLEGSRFLQLQKDETTEVAIRNWAIKNEFQSQQRVKKETGNFMRIGLFF